MSALRAVLKSKALRWTLFSLGGAIVLAFAALYGASEWMFATTYHRPAAALRTQTPGDVASGHRLAQVFGCVGCHGSHGRVLFEAPFVGRIVTPDLARVAPTYSDTELVNVIRHGIKRDGTSALVMPANAFSSMADTDVADIIAWLRGLKPGAETITLHTSAGPIGRALALTGGLRISARVPQDPAPAVAAPIDPIAHGEYIVKVVCSDCHELDQSHQVEPGLVAPPLREMVQAYDLDQFKHLMRDGKGAGERELRLMSEVARAGFSKMTDEEISAVHAYLNNTSTTAAN
jgi:mono/diheme cytochrome c family protein